MRKAKPKKRVILPDPVFNDRGIDYIVSYDGKTGDKIIGKTLPESLELTHIYINAGVSAQATLNGKNEITYESLYASKNLIKKQENTKSLLIRYQGTK